LCVAKVENNDFHQTETLCVAEVENNDLVKVASHPTETLCVAEVENNDSHQTETLCVAEVENNDLVEVASHPTETLCVAIVETKVDIDPHVVYLNYTTSDAADAEKWHLPPATTTPQADPIVIIDPSASSCNVM
jgi:uncharacterized protein YlxP (DUF503 family)